MKATWNYNWNALHQLANAKNIFELKFIVNFLMLFFFKKLVIYKKN